MAKGLEKMYWIVLFDCVLEKDGRMMSGDWKI